MSEIPVRSALFMDRDESLGNSLDTFGRRALHVKVGNIASTEAIPVYVVDAPVTAQTDLFIDVDTVSTPGVSQNLFTYVVPVGKQIALYSLKVSCRISSEYTLSVGSTLVASGFLGAAHPTDVFEWARFREFPTGASLVLSFLHYGPVNPSNPSMKVRAHLQAALI
jgi:hypothetical protein